MLCTQQILTGNTLQFFFTIAFFFYFAHIVFDIYMYTVMQFVIFFLCCYVFASRVSTFMINGIDIPIAKLIKLNCNIFIFTTLKLSMNSSTMNEGHDHCIDIGGIRFYTTDKRVKTVAVRIAHNGIVRDICKTSCSRVITQSGNSRNVLSSNC